jgi:hypothetical protein
MRISAFPSAVQAQLAYMWAMLSGFLDQRLGEADMPAGNGPVARAQQAATVISVVVIGVVALVGLLIFGEVYSAMPEMPTAVNGTADEIVGGFGDAIGLVPIILIVLLASVVIGVVQRMRGM